METETANCPAMEAAAGSSRGCGSARCTAKTKIDSGILQQHRFKVFKFTFCKYFFKGKCTRGSACTFAHGIEELRERPQLSKTRICEKWRQGLCEHVNSEDCKFAHGKEDLRIAKPGICDLHRQGLCAYGDNCRFAHNEDEVTTQLLLSSATKTPLEVHQAVQGAWNKLRRTTAYHSRSHHRKAGFYDQVSARDVPEPSLLCYGPARPLQQISDDTVVPGETSSPQRPDQPVELGTCSREPCVGRVSPPLAPDQALASGNSSRDLCVPTASTGLIDNTRMTIRTTPAPWSGCPDTYGPSSYEHNNGDANSPTLERRLTGAGGSVPLGLPQAKACQTIESHETVDSRFILERRACGSNVVRDKTGQVSSAEQRAVVEVAEGDTRTTRAEMSRSDVMCLGTTDFAGCSVSPREGSYRGSWSTRTSSDEGVAFSECAGRIQKWKAKGKSELSSHCGSRSRPIQGQMVDDDNSNGNCWRGGEKMEESIKAAWCSSSRSLIEKDCPTDRSRRNSAFGSSSVSGESIRYGCRTGDNCTVVTSVRSDASSTLWTGRGGTSSPDVTPGRRSLRDSGGSGALSDGVGSRAKTAKAKMTIPGLQPLSGLSRSLSPVRVDHGKTVTKVEDKRDHRCENRSSVSSTGEGYSSPQCKGDTGRLHELEYRGDSEVAVTPLGKFSRGEITSDGEILNREEVLCASDAPAKCLQEKRHTECGCVTVYYSHPQLPNPPQRTLVAPESRNSRWFSREHAVTRSFWRPTESNVNATAVEPQPQTSGERATHTSKADVRFWGERQRSLMNVDQQPQPPRLRCGDRSSTVFGTRKCRQYQCQQRSKQDLPASRKETTTCGASEFGVQGQKPARYVLHHPNTQSEFGATHNSGVYRRPVSTVGGHHRTSSKGLRVDNQKSAKRLMAEYQLVRRPLGPSPIPRRSRAVPQLCNPKIDDTSFAESLSSNVGLSSSRLSNEDVRQYKTDLDSSKQSTEEWSISAEGTIQPAVPSPQSDRDKPSPAPPAVVMPAFAKSKTSLMRNFSDTERFFGSCTRLLGFEKREDSRSQKVSSADGAISVCPDNIPVFGKIQSSSSDVVSIAYSPAPLRSHERAFPKNVIQPEKETKGSMILGRGEHEHRWNGTCLYEVGGKKRTQISPVFASCTVSSGFIAAPDAFGVQTGGSQKPGCREACGTLQWSLNAVQGRVLPGADAIEPPTFNLYGSEDHVAPLERTSPFFFDTQSVSCTNYHTMLRNLCMQLGAESITVFLAAAAARAQYAD